MSILNNPPEGGNPPDKKGKIKFVKVRVNVPLLKNWDAQGKVRSRLSLLEAKKRDELGRPVIHQEDPSDFVIEKDEIVDMPEALAIEYSNRVTVMGHFGVFKKLESAEEKLKRFKVAVVTILKDQEEESSE